MTGLRIRTFEDLQGIAALGRATLYPREPKIIVGTATCGRNAGAMDVLDALRDEVDRQQLDWPVTQTGCMGWCSQEPLLDLWIPGHARVTYGRVTPARARQIVRAAPNPIPDLALAILPGDDNAITGNYTQYIEGTNGKVGLLLPYKELPLFRHQVRIVMRNCGLVDPQSLPEYAARGGYSALWHALRMCTPAQILENLQASGLRERSGTGAEVWPRWKRMHDAASTPKCIICALDASGGCADQLLLESDPHSVVEGMVLAAYATGASEGILYLGRQYQLAYEMAELAISQAKSAGLLGQNILSSGFAFKVRIVGGESSRGCREESALIHAIEEHLEPFQPVPHSSAERPACLSTPETWANIPVIVARGGHWFAGRGTVHSKGTKVFMVSGDLLRPGPIEVPLGTSLQQIVQHNAGGLQAGHDAKAVRTGGSFGGFIPVDRFELGADYESLTAAYSNLGSGEIVVLDERTCMVGATRASVASLEGQSCGRCVCCRVGTRRLMEVLDNICQGRGKEQDIELLEDLAWLLKDTSGCDRGREAGNPVLSALRYFRGEFVTHIREQRCPARSCRDLITFEIDPVLCNGCGACLPVCTNGAVVGEPGRAHLIAQARCNKCGVCLEICGSDAVAVM